MKHLLLLLFVFVSIYAQAQKVTTCGYIIPKKSVFKTNFTSVYEAKDVVQKMLDTIKWKENFSLREQPNIQNAYATVINNKRWIIYDNQFLESIDEYAATKWASISIMAHEVGHHKYNHVLTGKGSTVPTEIEADNFSGYVMQKLGATLAQSVAAIKTIATDKASTTHPAKNDRVNAITAGWNKAAAEKPGAATPSTGTTTPGTGTGTKPPTTPTTPAPSTPTIPDDQNYIVLSMQNVKNERILLSDDGKNFQQQLMEPNKPFAFSFEIYKYGWLKLPHFNSYRIYKLEHGKDYSIIWNSRKQFWTVVQVPNE